MGAPTPKAFLPIAGHPLFSYSLQTLGAIPEVATVVLVVAADYLAAAATALKPYRTGRGSIRLTAGGAERQDSVAAGLAAVAGEVEVVLIHDAARPFVRAEAARRCLNLAQAHGAALVAVPARDTVKAVDDKGRVTHTLDRSTIWLAQTPQGFRVEILRDALDRARAAGVQATDDAALVERLGLPVHVVPGELANLKVTTPEDLRWAEWYARSEWCAPAAWDPVEMAD